MCSTRIMVYFYVYYGIYPAKEEKHRRVGFFRVRGRGSDCRSSPTDSGAAAAVAYYILQSAAATAAYVYIYIYLCIYAYTRRALPWLPGPVNRRERRAFHLPRRRPNFRGKRLFAGEERPCGEWASSRERERDSTRELDARRRRRQHPSRPRVYTHTHIYIYVNFFTIYI